MSKQKYQKKGKAIEDVKLLNIQKIDYAPNQQVWSYEKAF